MKRLVFLLSLIFCISSLASAQRKTPRAVKYGSNSAAGKTFVHDGIRFYYEVYGNGEPLLMVHGNGGSIADLSAQIAYFRTRYKVIAMDSRDQGRSADSSSKITYEKMTDDLAALLDHLKIGPVNVLGWSDGGIEALLLGIRHPQKVKKIAAMAANLNPSDEALEPEIIGLIKSRVSEMPASQRETPEGRREIKVTSMMLSEPNVELKELQSIKAPTLILAADHDAIRVKHTVDIYLHIPNSQLVIFPGATHMIPFDDPVLFNSTVERFLRTPFRKVDMLNDTVKSLEKMRVANQQ
jgi:pimeloyl-ACP methyl ester carboxylesterase